MTFGWEKKRWKRKASCLQSTGSSLARATSPLLSAVCLNLPAAVFTPQGDRVIRSPPPPPLSFLPCLPPSHPPFLFPRLSSCSRAPEEDCGSWQREKQYKQSGGDIKCSSFSGARLSYCRSPSCRNQTRLMCFSVPASLCTAYKEGSFLPTFNMMELYLYVFHHTQLPASPGPASLWPSLILRKIKSLAVPSRLSLSLLSVLFELFSLFVHAPQQRRWLRFAGRQPVSLLITTNKHAQWRLCKVCIG